MLQLDTIIGKKNKFKLFILFFLLIISSIMEFIGIGTVPVLIGIVLDTRNFVERLNEYYYFPALQDISKNTLLIYFSILIILIFLIKNLLQFFILRFQGNLVKEIKLYIVSKLFHKFLNINFLTFLNKKSSIINRILNLDAGNTTIFFLTFLNIFREVLVFIVICTLLLISNTVVSLYLIIFFIFFSLIFYLITSKKLLERGKRLQKLMSDQLRVVNETFGAIKEIKIFNIENYKKNEFLTKVKHNEKLIYKNYIIRSMPRILLETLSILAIFSVILFYSYGDYDLTSLLPFLSLLTVCIIRIIPSLNGISNALSTFKIIYPSYKTIQKEMQSLKIKNFESQKKEIKDFDSIELKDVSFQYSVDTPAVLKNLNIKINQGEKIGIIGKSGAGKTTLVNILLGLIKPTIGKIVINGTAVDLIEYSLKNKIGYVPQDIYLIDSTIKNNIAFGIDEIYQDYFKIINASKSAQIHSYINTLNLKYDTLVGENGVNLSIGQKQRIGIARALYRSPSILVLDESTSSLDPKTEKEFVDEIFNNNENKTIIFISHKMSALNKCDKIFNLETLKFVKD